MFGFLIGIVCLIGLVKVLRGGRRCGRGWHDGHRGRGHHGWHDQRHFGARGWMRWLFRRLDTTPGQEKEISKAVEEFLEETRAIKKQGKASRDEVARVLRNESLDEEALGELFSRHDDALREVHQAFAGALGRIHNALDPEQRETLAELIEAGPRRGFGGPYRGWAVSPTRHEENES